MLLPGIEEIGSKKIQRAKSIEVGIIDPKKAAILVTDNNCIAFDMNVCAPDALRAVADMLEGKQPEIVKAKSKVRKAK